MLKFVSLTVLAAVCCLVVSGVGLSAQQDKGRRLTGPFCIGKPYLRPIGGKGVPIIDLRPASSYESRLVNAKVAILRAGVVRSVGAKQACRPWENRRTGIAIPCRTLTPLKPEVYCDDQGGPAGPAGPAGKDGVNGTNGKDGANGGSGPAGPAGKVSVTQLTGSQSNCVQITGSDGSSGVICGSAGAKGDKGDPGAPGPKGADGVCACQEVGKCSPADSKDHKK